MSTLVVPMVSVAQVSDSESAASAQATATAPIDSAETDIVLCEDRMIPRDVGVTLSVDRASATLEAGDVVTRTVVVNNNLSQILTNVSVYVRVFGPLRESGVQPIELDAGVAADGIQIGANQSATVEVDLRVPIDAVTGDYEVALYVIDSNGTYLSGLPYIYSDRAATIPFSVTSTQTGSATASTQPYIDMEAAVITGATYLDTATTGFDTVVYDFGTTTLPVAQAEHPVFTIDIVNPTPELLATNVVWNQFDVSGSWNPTAANYSRTTRVQLPPNSTTSVSFHAANNVGQTTMVTAQLQGLNTVSRITMALEDSNAPTARLYAPALLPFPIDADTQVTLQTCAQLTDPALLAQGATLIMLLKDREGNTIHEFKRPYPVTTSFIHFSDQFTADTSFEYVTLDTILIQGGTILATKQRTYDCAVSGSDICPGAAGAESEDEIGATVTQAESETPAPAGTQPNQFDNEAARTNTIYVLLGLSVLFVAVSSGLMYFLWQRYGVK